MASHIGQGIAFIGVSIFAGWLAFQAVSSGDAQMDGDPSDEIAAQADAIAARVEADYDATEDATASDWSNTIETSFGEYVGPGAVCEGEYWQLASEGGKQSLSWMDDNGTPDLASDDFYVEYDFSFDGSTLSLWNGKIKTYRTDNPRDGTRVSDKEFPMQKTSDGILLNGELLQGCRN